MLQAILLQRLLSIVAIVITMTGSNGKIIINFMIIINYVHNTHVILIEICINILHILKIC